MNVSAPLRAPLLAELESARAFLDRALDGLPSDLWAVRPSAAYSPIGWHVGHVAAVQARFLLPAEASRYGALFDPAATAKPARVQLPEPEEIRAWLDDVLERVRATLLFGQVPREPGLPDDFLVQHVAQHELQHAEHVQVLAALCAGRLHQVPAAPRVRAAAERRTFPGGRVLIGSGDAARAYDNERPQHEIELAPFWLDGAPVTAGEFARFVEDGGYLDSAHWTEDGWAWRTAGDVAAPLGFGEQHREAPVTCLSWYEADAYARWRGARLPTEHELEAARVAPAGVWEWTSSWFQPYPGFRSYPYEGYSTPWFGTHRVLRGGSWATSPRLVRPSLRNWYEPGFREIPSGFRCAGGT
jgi:iron(II)-dependent oxidoreductase